MNIPGYLVESVGKSKDQHAISELVSALHAEKSNLEAMLAENKNQRDYLNLIIDQQAE